LARWPPLWQIDCEVENERERERCEVFICARRYTVTSSRAAEWSKERRCFVHEREREREKERGKSGVQEVITKVRDWPPRIAMYAIAS
jgi:hypothetical protein